MTDHPNRSAATEDDFQALREVEEAWLASELGRAISNLAYPVGCGAAPTDYHLKAAAKALFDRYAKMVEMARNTGAPAQPSGNINCSRCGGADAGCYICRDYPHQRLSAATEDVRWAVNYLLEQIAAKFEAWDTFDLFRSEAASTVRSFKHDMSSVSPQEARKP